MQFIFSNQAEKEFLKLDKNVQQIITKKLQKIKQWGWFELKSLVNMLPYTHRLRVGDYRLLLAECDEWYIVLSVWHRSVIYVE